MSNAQPQAKNKKLRLAYCSPLPPARTGIADYSLELLPALADQASLVLYSADPAAVAPDVRRQFDVRALSAYPEERWQFDVALYQMGNSSHHEDIYRIMRRYPGIMVLHDYVLHHFVAHRTVGHDDFAAYAREMGYALGAGGVGEAWAIRRGQAEHRLSALSLNQRLVDLNLGLLVHSRYVQRRLRAAGARCLVHQVPLPARQRQGKPRRDQLPWPHEALIVASLGQMTAAKQLDRALRAFARLHRRLPLARYLIVGEALPEVDLPGLLSELELGDRVYATGFVEQFADWLATADIVVNLRHPTLGETSGTVVHAMAAARAVVVNDAGWYAELPDDAVVKVPVQDDQALQQALETLADRPQQRQQLGQRARAYIASHHAPEVSAAAYTAAIEDILQQTVWQTAHA